MLPSLRGSLVNPNGFPALSPSPVIEERADYKDVLYSVEDIVSDWEAYSRHLKTKNPDFHPRVLFVSHDMSEIENITLMALGGVVRSLNGLPQYLLVNPDNVAKIDEFIERGQPEWLGFNLYTGLTDHVFEWIRTYKLKSAETLLKRPFSDFEEADRALKDLVREAGGPVMSGGRVLYAPIITGGHYNNHDYKTSYERGADYVVRGKGINLLKDILMRHYAPGIYHDPITFPNIPEFDRAGFYSDMFTFSDKTKKYPLSPIKSVLTALGCSYRCTYCYISSLIDNLKDSYEGTGVKPPSIIQDRPVELVLKEGLAIKELDKLYGLRTTAVFDQADISLNNLEWWQTLHPLWTSQVGIPFYIQARPAMLAGENGRKRISLIAKDRLVAGISMAIESGDPAVRRLLLKRLEGNEMITDALKNVKSFHIPIRTQAITGLPVIRPLRPTTADIGLVENGQEHYYDDPLQETLKCLDLVCASNTFSKEDYYWNSLYSPFPGTPLGDYSFPAGFHDGQTDHREKAYMFTTEVGLACFPPAVTRKQVAFHRTANFFAHLQNGKDMMTLFLYSHDLFDIKIFADFVDAKHDLFKLSPRASKFGFVPHASEEMLRDFFAHAYSKPEDAHFKEINIKLIPYYAALLDGLVLAAKVAVRYFKEQEKGSAFTLDLLTRVERNHYYDNSYNMAYIPPTYAVFLSAYTHETRQAA
jgi:radical SAM superfamily enzyme YgiQ (UPF0313 family)